MTRDEYEQSIKQQLGDLLAASQAIPDLKPVVARSVLGAQLSIAMADVLAPYSPSTINRILQEVQELAIITSIQHKLDTALKGVEDV